MFSPPVDGGSGARSATRGVAEGAQPITTFTSHQTVTPRYYDNPLVGYLTENCCGGQCRALRTCLQIGESKKPERRMTSRTYNALFLCTGNSARSIMAERLLQHRGEGRFRAFSAGSFPTGKVNPLAIATLRRLNVETAGLRSKSWDEFAAPGAPVMDFIFTVCDQAAGEVCPIWPGHPVTAHWGVPDPAAVQGTEAERMTAFADAARLLDHRIMKFTNLSIEKLDTPTLKRILRDVGSFESAQPQ